MIPDIAPPESPAARALARCLRSVLPDDDAAQRILAKALQSAGRSEVPSDAVELLAFVRGHLVLFLSHATTPRNALALLDRLARELPEAGATWHKTGPRPRANDDDPETVRAADLERNPRHSGTVPHRPTPRLGLRAPSDLRPAVTVPASATPNATPSDPAAPAKPAPPAKPADSSPSLATGRRATVILVDPDRLARSSMARSLVSARCDVRTPDRAADLPAAIGDGVGVVMVVRADEEALVTTTPFLSRARQLPVVMCTNASVEIVERLLAGAGIERFAVLPKAASFAELMAHARALLAK